MLQVYNSKGVSALWPREKSKLAFACTCCNACVTATRLLFVARGVCCFQDGEDVKNDQFDAAYDLSSADEGRQQNGVAHRRRPRHYQQQETLLKLLMFAFYVFSSSRVSF